MSFATRHGSGTELVVAAEQWDGSHSGTQLSRCVQSGRSLRVRRGIYVDSNAWIEAPPWDRYRIATAATALDTHPLFCRETALLLHGSPLAKMPAAVMARTLRSGGTGRITPPPLTGSLSKDRFWKKYQSRHLSSTELRPQSLDNVPTKLIAPPQLAGVPRLAMIDGLLTGRYPVHEVAIPQQTELGIQGPAEYRVEPLELALIDTVSRIPFDQAVVILDWAKTCPTLDLAPWYQYLRTAKMRRLWDQAWAFASHQSESPGESRSRALMHSLGFAPPALQQEISTHRGRFRADFCWEEDGVLGEFDGRTKYLDDSTLNGRDIREVLYHEKLREDALSDAGWRVVRWVWADLARPDRFRSILAGAGVSLGR